MSELFSKSEAMLGSEAMKRLAEAKVLVVGVGGVGSWCAEALVRTGLGHITLVDDDIVAESNVNRQCPATAATVGRPKVEVMAGRLKEINPACEVEAICEHYPCSLLPVPCSLLPVPCSLFPVPYSLIVDAIDSVDCKAELILRATEEGVPLVSSMGAALRLDPTKVKVTRFEKVEGDGLARALRQRFKKLNRFPAAKFSCVWSAEQVHENQTIKQSNNQTMAKGSLMPVTATFGMCLASEAIKILTKGEMK